MIIASALTNNGTSFTASPASSLTTGRVTVGTSAAQQSFATADIGYAISARLTTSSTTATLDVQTGVCTGSAAFVAGVAQVETATVVAAAGATSSGTACRTRITRSRSSCPWSWHRYTPSLAQEHWGTQCTCWLRYTLFQGHEHGAGRPETRYALANSDSPPIIYLSVV